MTTLIGLGGAYLALAAADAVEVHRWLRDPG
jgi:hypothetical protein